jgi:ubiquinone/menaquinone biosynthesis C-methylase UbiE
MINFPDILFMGETHPIIQHYIRQEIVLEKITDWFLLWRQLVEAHDRYWDIKKKQKQKNADVWQDRARHFDKMVKKRWSKPDSSRELMRLMLEDNPGSTVLDIGAGTGAWAIFMAQNALHVTAIEPSESMCEVMRERLSAENITNVSIIQANWPDMDVDMHDFSFASHSMYGVADFRAFVEKMNQVTRKRCFLLMRVLLADAPMAKAAMRVWGQPYDSPNFQVAHNALMQMDIYPDVVMETEKGWTPWTHDTLEMAHSEVKNRLNLENDSTHDRFLRSLLEDALTEKEGRYVWPVGNRSGILHWPVRG